MTFKSLLKFWEQPPLINADLRDLWDEIHALDSFSARLSPIYLNKPIISDGYNKSKKTSLLPSLRIGSKAEASYLPIEYFKSHAEEFFHSKAPAEKTFHSSGTTAQQISRSYFSQDGLNLYKLGALKSFYHVLADVFGQNPLPLRGLSLVPPTNEWPDSSLAQMVAWIGEYWPVTYCTPDNLSDELTLMSLTSQEPVWIFGTASHFVQFMELSGPTKLPKGSFLVETGGAKGSAQKFSRRQLYSELCRHFSISHHGIVSEYGMCELASQAYDWVSPKLGSSMEFEHRQYRFPGWVSIYVTQGLRHATEAGAGALIVQDPLRVDYPWPIRTQDLATLDFKYGFCLNGRVPHAPLKGCSLLASDHEKLFDDHPAYRAEVWQIDRDAVLRRAQVLAREFEGFCNSPLIVQQMAREIGSLSAASYLLHQTVKAAAQSSEQWLQAVLKSIGSNSSGVTSVPKRWLFVAPSNHAIASFQPLALAYLAGLKVNLRMPQRFDTANSVLQMFYSFISKLPDAAIARVDSTLRFGTSKLDQEIDAVLFFGSNETLEEIRNHSSVPIRAFGSSVAISFVDCELTHSEIDSIISDAFSLSQKGCMSTRAIVSLREGHATDPALSMLLQKSFRNFWKEPLTIAQRCALDCEELALQQFGHATFLRQQYDDLLIPFYDHKNFDPKRDQIEFALPVITVGDVTKTNLHERISTVVKDFANVKFIFLPQQYVNNSLLLTKLQALLPDITITANGSSNNMPWNGLHEKRPLFLLT